MKNSLKKNIAYNFIYQLLVIALPFITAPYLARIIGAEGVGIYSFSQSMALYFTYFTLLGLSNYGSRTIASVQNDYYTKSKKFCEIYSMQLIMFFISLIGYIVYVLYFSVDKFAATIMGVWFLSSAFDINWLFFGMEQFKLTVIRNLIIKVLTVICIFIFVRNKNDVYTYIVIMSFSTLISQLCLLPHLKKFICFVRPSFKNILAHFKPNFILFIPVIAVSLYKIMDKIMLGYMCTMSEVGYYENAEKIINIVISLIVAIGTVMLPRMTALVANNNYSESKKYIDNTMLIVQLYVNAAMFGLIAIANEFSIAYFGDGFVKTGIIIAYLSITVIFLGCGNVIRTQFIIPNKLDKIYINSAIIGAIINLLINIVLIPRLESIGAAIGTIFAEFSVVAYQFFKVRKYVDVRKYLKYQCIFMGIGAIMLICIKTIPQIDNIYLSLSIKILVGTFVYIIISSIYLIKFEKNKLIIYMLQRIRK